MSTQTRQTSSHLIDGLTQAQPIVEFGVKDWVLKVLEGGELVLIADTLNSASTPRVVPRAHLVEQALACIPGRNPHDMYAIASVCGSSDSRVVAWEDEVIELDSSKIDDALGMYIYRGIGYVNRTVLLQCIVRNRATRTLTRLAGRNKKKPKGFK